MVMDEWMDPMDGWINGLMEFGDAHVDRDFQSSIDPSIQQSTNPPIQSLDAFVVQHRAAVRACVIGEVPSPTEKQRLGRIPAIPTPACTCSLVLERSRAFGTMRAERRPD